MRIAYWIVTGLFCLMMLAGAAMELFAFGESVKMLYQLGFPEFIAYVLPVTKIAGVIAILTRYSNTLKEWAYAGFFFDFVLAALAHYFSGVPSPIAAIVALVLLMTPMRLARKFMDKFADCFVQTTSISPNIRINAAVYQTTAY